MKKILCVLFVLILSCTAYAQDVLRKYCPHPELNENECGYVNSNNEIVIPVGKYAYLYSSTFDKIAFVLKKGEKGIYAIDRLERTLFQVYVVDNGPDYLSNGTFRIIQNQKIGYADMSGRILIKPQFDFAFPFHKNGYAVFNVGGNLMKDGVYSYYKGGRWGVVDINGNIIVEPKYEEGRKSALKYDGKWYDIDEILSSKGLL